MEPEAIDETMAFEIDVGRRRREVAEGSVREKAMVGENFVDPEIRVEHERAIEVHKWHNGRQANGSRRDVGPR